MCRFVFFSTLQRHWGNVGKGAIPVQDALLVALCECRGQLVQQLRGVSLCVVSASHDTVEQLAAWPHCTDALRGGFALVGLTRQHEKEFPTEKKRKEKASLTLWCKALYFTSSGRQQPGVAVLL